MRRRPLVAFPRIQQLTFGSCDVENAIRLCQFATVGERGHAADVFHDRDAAIAKRHRTGFLDAINSQALSQFDDFLAPDFERQGGGDGVQRPGEGAPQRHVLAAAATAAEILWRPSAWTTRRGRAIAHNGVGRHAGFHGGGVDVDLERRAGLTTRLGGAVELIFAIVLATDNGFDGAVGFHHDHGAGIEVNRFANFRD